MRPWSEAGLRRQTGVEVDAAETVFRAIFDTEPQANAATTAVDKPFGCRNLPGVLKSDPGGGIV